MNYIGPPTGFVVVRGILGVHNETRHIWTHLVGVIMLGGSLCHLYGTLRPQPSPSSVADVAAVSIYQ